MAASTGSEATLRAAREDDVDVISTVWHAGWADGHLGHVPRAVLAHRRAEDFRRRVPVLLDRTTVAVVTSRVVGFVVTHDDEVEQLYVDATYRGSGVAGQLLRHGERVVGARYATAWLAVVAGNARARRFYERHGWSDRGPFDNPAFGNDGTTILVPTLRYEKAVGRERST